MFRSRWREERAAGRERLAEVGPVIGTHVGPGLLGACRGDVGPRCFVVPLS